MNHANNLALIEVSKVWEIDGDWMRCRACRAVLIASRDGEPLRHKPECKNAAHVHPWSDLRKAMDVTPVQTGAVGSVPGWKLVPVEPTQAMLDAVGPKPVNWDATPTSKALREECDEMRREDYRAMLAASPTPPQAGGGFTCLMDGKCVHCPCPQLCHERYGRPTGAGASLSDGGE